MLILYFTALRAQLALAWNSGTGGGGGGGSGGGNTASNSSLSNGPRFVRVCCALGGGCVYVTSLYKSSFVVVSGCSRAVVVFSLVGKFASHLCIFEAIT